MRTDSLPAHLGRRISDGRSRLEQRIPLRGYILQKRPYDSKDTNPPSREYYSLCLGNLAPEPLDFPGIEAQSSTELN